MKFEPTVVEFVIYTYRAYVVLVLAIFFPHLVQTHAKVTKTKKKKIKHHKGALSKPTSVNAANKVQSLQLDYYGINRVDLDTIFFSVLCTIIFRIPFL